MNNTLQVQYSGAGQVGTYNFGVNGALTVPPLVETSDGRFKTNVQPLENALDMAQRLAGVSFDWKDSGRASIGFVAQDVEAILPQLVLFQYDIHRCSGSVSVTV